MTYKVSSGLRERRTPHLWEFRGLALGNSSGSSPRWVWISAQACRASALSLGSWPLPTNPRAVGFPRCPALSKHRVPAPPAHRCPPGIDFGWHGAHLNCSSLRGHSASGLRSQRLGFHHSIQGFCWFKQQSEYGPWKHHQHLGRADSPPNLNLPCSGMLTINAISEQAWFPTLAAHFPDQV